MILGIFSQLKRHEKKAAIVLQIGTFLEYFDLMIYVHMSVLLNELFFPKTDPDTANLISAASFCTTFIFRPFGSLIFGYIGDTVGRKHTVVITTIMMSICCIIMANLPTYAQIGITAAWLFTICRVLQGLASMGEIIGAQIYLTELIKIPERYPIVTFIGCADFLGGVAALSVASMVLAFNLEWRVVFWIGALIAVVGSVARTALRETPEFVDAKLQLKKRLEKASMNADVILKEDPIVNEKVKLKTSIAYFFIQCSRPVWFYFLYVHCAGILKHSFNYSAQQIIQHNLLLATVEFLTLLFYGYLSYTVYPLKIVNIRIIIFSVFVIFIPYLLFNITTAMQLLILQSLICICKPTQSPATPIIYAYFPIFKRFRYVSFLFALARAIMYIVTSFGLVWLTKMFGHYGLLIAFIPAILGIKFGIAHFEKLEKATGNYSALQSNVALAV